MHQQLVTDSVESQWQEAPFQLSGQHKWQRPLRPDTLDHSRLLDHSSKLHTLFKWSCWIYKPCAVYLGITGRFSNKPSTSIFVQNFFTSSLFCNMDKQNKISERPIFCRDISWEHFPNWTRLSRMFSQDCGLPPFLEPRDLDWIDWAKRRLDSFSWPSFAQSPLLSPFDGEKQPKAEAAGHQIEVSEIQMGPHGWRVNLDVNHFMPEDIQVATKAGYLLISGAWTLVIWLRDLVLHRSISQKKKHFTIILISRESWGKTEYTRSGFKMFHTEIQVGLPQTHESGLYCGTSWWKC